MLTALVAVAVLALTGCAAAPDAASTAQGWSEPVTVTRGGGIAGVRDVVTIQPDGSWRRTARAAAETSGVLPAAVWSDVVSSLVDPALRAEGSRAVPDLGCPDAFEYELRTADIGVRWLDCGPALPEPPVAARIARLLLSGTA